MSSLDVCSWILLKVACLEMGKKHLGVTPQLTATSWCSLLGQVRKSCLSWDLWHFTSVWKPEWKAITETHFHKFCEEFMKSWSELVLAFICKVWKLTPPLHCFLTSWNPWKHSAFKVVEQWCLVYAQSVLSSGKCGQDNPIEIIILFVALILHHRKCISVRVSTGTQIKGLDKGGYECLILRLNTTN